MRSYHLNALCLEIFIQLVAVVGLVPDQPLQLFFREPPSNVCSTSLLSCGVALSAHTETKD
ncbi:MAG: hypothetical protein ACUVTL_03960 [Thermoproteota archaeon]